MKVLYITAACLTKNTSANMSHNGFVKGLIDCGCKVDVIMSKDSWGEEDKVLPKWKEVCYYEFASESFSERLRKNGRQIMVPATLVSNDHCSVVGDDGLSGEKFLHKVYGQLRELLKTVFYFIVHQDQLYPLEYTMFSTVMKFKSETEYDLVISNSSPAASHKVAELLIRKKRVRCKRWVQIWEDPWFYDLYGGKSIEIRDEEHRLLLVASEVYYVSPLTMMYQMKYFSDCAEKMKVVPLPFFQFSMNKENNNNAKELVFGYFGDYYSCTRNLQPFYDALCETGCTGYIYGDSDVNLKSTNDIIVSNRVTLDILAEVQEKTNVLVHLCNLRGGQIPGKIYHYSATNKKILFILDGTNEEKDMLYHFFSQYNRYYFCNNTESDILNTMNRMKIDTSVSNDIVKEFEPKNVVKQIIDKESCA